MNINKTLFFSPESNPTLPCKNVVLKPIYRTLYLYVCTGGIAKTYLLAPHTKGGFMSNLSNAYLFICN